MSAVISSQSLNFAYRRAPVLQDISLDIHEGQLVAIMGGSGSGKTTLLRLISGQQRHFTGGLSVFGMTMGMAQQDHELYELRKKIGMLFQFGGLFTDMSVLDNVAYPLRAHTHLTPQTIREISLLKLQVVGLRGAADLFPSEISGGMARRVALARAIALDPSLILYDEPFSGLDPVSLSVYCGIDSPPE